MLVGGSFEQISNIAAEFTALFERNCSAAEKLVVANGLRGRILDGGHWVAQLHALFRIWNGGANPQVSPNVPMIVG